MVKNDGGLDEVLACICITTSLNVNDPSLFAHRIPGPFCRRL